MRILHVTQPTTAGTAEIVLALVEGGVARGHSVSVASPDDASFVRRVERAGARWHRVPLVRRPGVHDLLRVRDVRRLLGDVDVVHLHSSKAGAVGRVAVASMRRRPRCVFTPHAWSWYVGGRAAPVYRRVERLLARYAERIVTVSEQERLDGATVLGTRTRLSVVPNGVDTQRFGVPPRPVHDPLGVLFVGRLDRQKGADRLLDALALTGGAVALTVLGDGRSADDLRAQAHRLPRPDLVRFVGPGDPTDFYARADVVCLPSRWEGMSLVMLEAMASGCAVVATRCGGTEALAGGAGVVIGQGDDAAVAREIADTLITLAGDHAAVATLASAARTRAEAAYTTQHMLDRYEAVWQGGEPSPA